MFRVCVPLVALKVTVPVLEVNVPELTQLPVSVMVPLVVCKVPALVMLPGTVSVPVLTLIVEPDGIVRLAPHAEETRNIAARVSVEERMMGKILIPVGINININSKRKFVSK